MNILLGVGNSILSDDGAGIYVAASFERDGWLSFECGTAPENFTSIVRREEPDLVVIVDAARMGLSPGEIRQIPEEKISAVSFGTHQLPLSQLSAYLKNYAKKIIIIGIEPETTGFGEELSPAVKEACNKLLPVLKKNPCEIDLLE